MTQNFPAYDLSGKRALITGAAGLLGVQHAAALLASGANVVLTDVAEDALMAARDSLASEFDGGAIDVRVMNVTQPGDVHGVAAVLSREKKRVDILVNNAAIDPKVKSESASVEMTRLENFTLEQWNLEIAVGLTGAFLCGQVFGSMMAADGRGGVILNIASDLSVISPDQRLYRVEGKPENAQPVKPVTYSVIKAGLIGLTRYLATYWADKGVRANALSPGGVHNNQPAEFVNDLVSRIPSGRMARHDEYRSAVQFLCSDASAYMNGQNLVMDGGRSVW
ncbi:MAG: SDR family oxidoreductase [Gemmatimonadaceae bacterium]|nr:SDR family oxidoreductase [Gemmatimonadaceae bacterium]MBA3655781.1 SDR family oxidoreductase [Gemmatimonadaceae bacterium]